MSVGRRSRMRRLVLQVRPAQIRIVADACALGIDDQTFGAPEVRQAVELTVESGVAANDLQHLGPKLLHLDAAHIKRPVDAELALHPGDAILRGLRQVEARATRGAQLGDHLLVVRERHQHLDASLLLEERDDIGRGVVGPGDEAQLGVIRSLRTGEDAREQTTPVRSSSHRGVSRGCGRLGQCAAASARS